MGKPDGKAMYTYLLELYAEQKGIEIGFRFEGEEEVHYVNKNKNRTDAEREKLFYERICEREQRNAQIPS